MRKPVVLKGPGSTPEQYAREMGISQERQAMIREIVDEVENRTKGKGPNRPAARDKKEIAPRTCPA